MYRHECKWEECDCRVIKTRHNCGAAIIGCEEGEQRQTRKKDALVVVHFEDAAFDDTHVSVPHNLVSEGQKRETERERTVSENSNAALNCYDRLLL